MIKPRVATADDVANIVRLGKALRDSSTYATKSFSMEKAALAVTNLVESDTDLALVAEQAGVMVGFLLGGLTYEWFSDDLIAFDYSIYVVPNLRNGRLAIKFLKTFEQWAIAKGAINMQLGISTGIHVDNTSHFYQLLGFTESGRMFEKKL